MRVEVRDEGGPWNEHPGVDGRPHGLAIVRHLAVDSGTDGDALTGWIAWARIDWPDRGRACTDERGAGLSASNLS